MRGALTVRFVVLVAAYAVGLAVIWYSLTPGSLWKVAAAEVPLNLAVGLAIGGRWWAPLLAGIAVPIALPDTPTVEGAPVWFLPLAFVALPGAAVILVGVLLRTALDRRRPGPPSSIATREAPRAR